ncbi:MAG: hypothetical protein EXS09_11880 [Gemmataceae bacterium]|nr:hypothetical protein [Gemmataceae bacterium]
MDVERKELDLPRNTHMSRSRYSRLNCETLEARDVPSTATLSSTGVLKILGTPADDEITVRQVAGVISIDNTTIQYASSTVASVPVASVKRIDIWGYAGDDTIFLGAANQEVVVKTNIYGGIGNDWVYGGIGTDTIKGGAGHDSIFGNLGTDALYGNDGHDFLDDGDRLNSEIVAGGLGWDWNADVVAIGGTRTKDVQQGDSPTCSFLASLSGLCDIGYDFREWITYDGVNEEGVPVYSVAFWDGSDWAEQTIEFDGTLFDSDADPRVEGESWVVLMNRAWMAWRDDDGTALPEEAIYALTGTEASSADYTDTMMADAELDVIIDTLNQGGMVVAATGNEQYLATDILIASHSYTVQDVQEYRGQIWLTLRNPWGIDGGALTSGNKYDGFVFVTWEEFQQSMVTLATF